MKTGQQKQKEQGLKPFEPSKRLGAVTIRSAVRTYVALLVVALLGLVICVVASIGQYGKVIQLKTMESNVLLLQNAMIDQETGQRGYELTGNSGFLAPWNSGTSDFQKYKTVITSELANAPSVTTDINRMLSAADTWHNNFGRRQISLKQSRHIITVRELLAGKAHFDAFRKTVSAAMNQIQKSERTEQHRLALYITSTVSGVALVLIFLAAFNTRNLVRRFRAIIDPIEELSLAVNELTQAQFDVPLPIYVESNELGELVRDIDFMRQELKSRYREVEELAYHNQLLLDSAGEGIFGVDERLTITFANPRVEQMLGYSRHELVGKAVLHTLVPHVLPTLAHQEATVEDLLRSLPSQRISELGFRTKSGSAIPVEYRITPMLEYEKVVGAVVTFDDIQQRLDIEDELRISELRYRRLIELTPQMIAVHRDTKFVFVNPAAAGLLGVDSEEDLLGRNITDFLPESSHETFRQQREKAMNGETAWYAEEQMVRADGSVIDVETAMTPITFNGEAGILMISRDITERKRAVETINYLAYHDTLTDLPNRRFFRERLEGELSELVFQSTDRCAVLFLDLDGFKHINDNFGHDVGDQLLIQVANRIRNSVRSTDVVGRLGGDEFTVLLSRIHSSEDAARVADVILRALASPVHIHGVEHRVTTSIGIAMFPEAGTSSEELMKNADIAMYAAKNSGKNQCVMFQSNLDSTEVVDRI